MFFKKLISVVESISDVSHPPLPSPRGWASAPGCRHTVVCARGLCPWACWFYGSSSLETPSPAVPGLLSPSFRDLLKCRFHSEALATPVTEKDGSTPASSALRSCLVSPRSYLFLAQMCCVLMFLCFCSTGRVYRRTRSSVAALFLRGSEMSLATSSRQCGKA